MTDIQTADQDIQPVAKQKLKRKKSLTLKSLGSNRVAKLNQGTIILADISGSMSGTKMRELKGALTKVWSPGIQGIAFNDMLFELHEEDIQFMDADGTTAMFEALREAWSRKPKHIILLTDGYPDGGSMRILEEASFHTDIPVDTVGIGGSQGHDYDSEFLQELARLTGGRFTDVGEPMRLTETLQFLLDYKPNGLQEPKNESIQL